MASNTNSIKLKWLDPDRSTHATSHETRPLTSQETNELTTVAKPHKFPDPSEFLDEFKQLKKWIQSGTRKSIEHITKLLDETESEILVNFKDSENVGQTLLHIAAFEGNPELVKILLSRGADPNACDGSFKTPLHFVVDGSCRCKTCTAKKVECITLLIDFGAKPDPLDNLGHTPLFYSAKKLYPQCAKTLLDNGANLFEGDSEREVIPLLAEYLPEVLKEELDESVTQDADDPLKIHVDFSLLLQIDQSDQKALGNSSFSKMPKETELLQCVLKARGGYEQVVTHPVVEAFLHFKWMVVRRIFLFLRSIYLLLVILYTTLIFRIYSNKCIDDFYFGGIGELCKITDFDTISAFILYAAVGLIALSEFLKLYNDFENYFSKESVGFLWWILCLGWAGTLIPVFGPPPLYYHYPVAAVSVIFSWLMTLVQLGRMPWFAIHVGLLVKVVKDFLRLLATFFTVLIAFALGFCILLPDNRNFNDVPFALFKTFMMMKGDIDYDGILDKRTNSFLGFIEYSIPAHIIYTVFVIVVTMVLTSLLIGLAVKDIEEAQKQAQINRSVRLIQEIGIFESIIYNKFLTCWMTACLSKWFSIRGNKEIKGNGFSFSPLHPDDTTLPEDIKRRFIPYYNPSKCQRHQRRRTKKPQL